MGGGLILASLQESLHGNEANKGVVVDDWDALDLVLVHQFEGLPRADAGVGGDDLVCHRLADRVRFANFEIRPDVCAGDNSEYGVVVGNDGRAGDALTVHHLVDLGDGLVGCGGDDVFAVDHQLVGAFDPLYLGGHLLDIHVSVEDTESALAGHPNGGVALGDRIHRRREHGDIEFDVFRDTCRDVGVVGFDAALLGAKEHVVERQCFRDL